MDERQGGPSVIDALPLQQDLHLDEEETALAASILDVESSAGRARLDHALSERIVASRSYPRAPQLHVQKASVLVELPDWEEPSRKGSRLLASVRNVLAAVPGRADLLLGPSYTDASVLSGYFASEGPRAGEVELRPMVTQAALSEPLLEVRVEDGGETVYLRSETEVAVFEPDACLETVDPVVDGSAVCRMTEAFRIQVLGALGVCPNPFVFGQFATLHPVGVRVWDVPSDERAPPMRDVEGGIEAALWWNHPEQIIVASGHLGLLDLRERAQPASLLHSRVGALQGLSYFDGVESMERWPWSEHQLMAAARGPAQALLFDVRMLDAPMLQVPMPQSAALFPKDIYSNGDLGHAFHDPRGLRAIAISGAHPRAGDGRQRWLAVPHVGGHKVGVACWHEAEGSRPSAGRPAEFSLRVRPGTFLEAVGRTPEGREDRLLGAALLPLEARRGDAGADAGASERGESDLEASGGAALFCWANAAGLTCHLISSAKDGAQLPRRGRVDAEAAAGVAHPSPPCGDIVLAAADAAEPSPPCGDIVSTVGAAAASGAAEPSPPCGETVSAGPPRGGADVMNTWQRMVNEENAKLAYDTPMAGRDGSDEDNESSASEGGEGASPELAARWLATAGAEVALVLESLGLAQRVDRPEAAGELGRQGGKPFRLNPEAALIMSEFWLGVAAKQKDGAPPQKITLGNRVESDAGPPPPFFDPNFDTTPVLGGSDAAAWTPAGPDGDLQMLTPVPPPAAGIPPAPPVLPIEESALASQSQKPRPGGEEGDRPLKSMLDEAEQLMSERKSSERQAVGVVLPRNANASETSMAYVRRLLGVEAEPSVRSQDKGSTAGRLLAVMKLLGVKLPDGWSLALGGPEATLGPVTVREATARAMTAAPLPSRREKFGVPLMRRPRTGRTAGSRALLRALARAGILECANPPPRFLRRGSADSSAPPPLTRSRYIEAYVGPWSTPQRFQPAAYVAATQESQKLEEMLRAEWRSGGADRYGAPGSRGALPTSVSPGALTSGHLTPFLGSSFTPRPVPLMGAAAASPRSLGGASPGAGGTPQLAGGVFGPPRTPWAGGGPLTPAGGMGTPPTPLGGLPHTPGGVPPTPGGVPATPGGMATPGGTARKRRRAGF